MDKVLIMVQNSLRRGNFGGLVVAGVLAAALALRNKADGSGSDNATDSSTTNNQNNKQSE